MRTTIANQFLTQLKYQKKYSKHTLLAYSTDLEQFQNFLIDQFEISNLEKAESEHIRSWIVSLSDSGVKSRSINRKISSLRSFYQWLKKNGQLEVTPTTALKALKTPKSLPKYVEQSELNSLLDQLSLSDDYQEALESAVFVLLYHAGMRQAELIGLQEDKINWTGQTVKVLGKRNKERIIPIGEEAIQFLYNFHKLKKERHGSSNQFFLTLKGKPLYPKLVYNIVNRYLKIFSKVDQKSPHVLRHSFATHMLRNGADLSSIKELLGHTSLAATQVYTHNDIQHLKEIHQQLHPKS